MICWGIHGSLANYLPPENRSSSFDTVARQQGMSAVHLQGYLVAADVAMEEAIQLGPRPNLKPIEMKYQNASLRDNVVRATIEEWRPNRQTGLTGHGLVLMLSPHVAQSNNMGYRPRKAGALPHHCRSIRVSGQDGCFISNLQGARTSKVALN